MTHLIARVVLSIVSLQVACELISVKMYNDDSKQEAFVNAALSSKVGEFNCVQKAVFFSRPCLVANTHLFVSSLRTAYFCINVFGHLAQGDRRHIETKAVPAPAGRAGPSACSDDTMEPPFRFCDR